MMKRNFLIKAFVCLFTVVALCSCSKDDDEENSNGSIPNKMVIAVENGASYNEKIDVVKVEIYSESSNNYVPLVSAPYENGGFTLDLPESVSAQYLEGIDFEEGVPQGLTVSNLNAKIGWVYLSAYKLSDETGYFYHGTGDWEGGLVYLDSDYNMTGSHTESETYEEVIYTYKETYNVHGKRGWNMVYEKETNKGNNSYEYEMTTAVPAGAKWSFYDYSSEQSSVSGALLKSKTLSAKLKSKTLSAKRKFGLK
jgi:hypothetical protein